MAKKSFKGANPAMQFISAAVAEQYSDYNQQDVSTPSVTKAVPMMQQERKTKRLNLLLQPSVIESFNKVVHMKKTSINDLVNTLMKTCCDENSELITKYNDIFGD